MYVNKRDKIIFFTEIQYGDGKIKHSTPPIFLSMMISRFIVCCFIFTAADGHWIFHFPQRQVWYRIRENNENPVGDSVEKKNII